MMPSVLLATTCRWLPTVRLAMALADSGFLVAAVCPSNHPIRHLGSSCKSYPYRGLVPLRSIANAISQMKPDLVLPGDDLATRHLHRLFEQEQAKGQSDGWICRLIERSLGAAASFEIVYARAKFIETAREQGIRAPETAVIRDVMELHSWIGRAGFPTVLKADGSSGGDGVKIVRTIREAEQAFHQLQAPPLLARAAKRSLIDHDNTLIWPSLSRQRSAVNAQAFIDGREATSMVACWDGSVLATLHFDVIQKRDASGPATVIRQIEDPDMSKAVQRMVRRLKLSGVHGFDFMRDAENGQAHLIEINPRAAQVGHLSLGPGKDLPAALFAAVSRKSLSPTPAVTEKEIIALFPQEWQRDPGSPFLRSAYHDVPWGQPEFVRSCIRKRVRPVSKRDQHKATRVVQAIKVLPRSTPVEVSEIRIFGSRSDTQYE